MKDKPITSTANPLIKKIRSLQHRKYRGQEGEFFVEGIRPVWQAIEGAANIDTIVYSPELLSSKSALDMVRSAGANGIEIVEASGKVFASIARRENPSGLGALVRTGHQELQDLSVNSGSVYVALHEARNPGNIGTIVRTLDAVGGNGLLLIGDSGDPYHPAAVKASMGSLFKMPVLQIEQPGDVLNWCDVNHISVVTTSPQAVPSYWSVDYPSPLLFLFGSEGRGLDKEIVDRGDMSVRIPMRGAADSLNLAVAVGVLLYEFERQRSGIRDKLQVTA